MTMRTWRGAVRPADEQRYLRHQGDTGVSEYRATPGNAGAPGLEARAEGILPAHGRLPEDRRHPPPP